MKYWLIRESTEDNRFWYSIFRGKKPPQKLDDGDYEDDKGFLAALTTSQFGALFDSDTPRPKPGECIEIKRPSLQQETP